MILDTPTKTKLSSLASVEAAALYLAMLLADTYQQTRVIEGVDVNNNEVSVNACTVDFLPVTHASGSKEWRIVTRLSFSANQNLAYKAAKWESVNVYGGDTPNVSITNVASGT